MSCLFSPEIEQLRHSIVCQLSDSPFSQPLPPEPIHAGPQLDTIPPVTASEVSKLLNSMPSKTSILDCIPTSLLKSSHLKFSELITKLATMFFHEGCFPHSYDLNNISKIVEKLSFSRLQSHILTSPKFNPYQSAYRRNHSTATALLCIFNHVFHSANAQKSTILVSLDLSAAFDTIDHSILLNRFRSTFGISGAALQRITSYLTNRSQCVKLGNSLSNHKLSTSGVPQGSVLGPPLFTIYVSPIVSLLSNMLTNINMQTILNSSSPSLSHQLPPTFTHSNQHSLTYPSGSLLIALP
jgi:Reverse transcriptase (RNA-dependent DNA polymerase)